MQNILVAAPAKTSGPAMPFVAALRTAGYAVAVCLLDEDEDILCDLFAGRPPDLVVADLSSTRNCLPLRHLGRLLRGAWGENISLPPFISLLHENHMTLPDWPAYTDDFLAYPYAAPELLARVALLLFRRRHVQTDDTVLFADIVVDMANCVARSVGDGAVLALTPREFELLRFFVTHRGKFFARDRLLDLVWGVHFEGGERTVDIHVRRLRSKLPPETVARLETRRGVGYGLRVLP